MARNATESDFWTSKMAADSHFVKKKFTKLKLITKIKVAYRSEMARNVIESEFRTSKMDAGGHFVKKFHKNKNCGRFY